MNSYEVLFVVLVLAFSDLPFLTAQRTDEPMTTTDISDWLERIEKTCCRCSSVILANCSIDFAAYGFDDGVKQGYIRTSEGSYHDLRNACRGVTTVEINPVTCKTRNRQTFDTHDRSHDIVQFLETMESATVGTIIVGVSSDSVEHNGGFQDVAGAMFTRYNMNIFGLQWRDKFAFILQKGYPKKTIFEKKARYLNYLRIKVGIRGPSAAEAEFIRIL